MCSEDGAKGVATSSDRLGISVPLSVNLTIPLVPMGTRAVLDQVAKTMALEAGTRSGIRPRPGLGRLVKGLSVPRPLSAAISISTARPWSCSSVTTWCYLDIRRPTTVNARGSGGVCSASTGGMVPSCRGVVSASIRVASRMVQRLAVCSVLLRRHLPLK